MFFADFIISKVLLSVSFLTSLKYIFTRECCRKGAGMRVVADFERAILDSSQRPFALDIVICCA